jgi:hypothetical protein
MGYKQWRQLRATCLRQRPFEPLSMRKTVACDAATPLIHSFGFVLLGIPVAVTFFQVMLFTDAVN